MSLFDGQPRRPEIVLWKYRWRSGSNAPAPLLPIGLILLFVGSILLLLMGTYAYKEHRLSSEGKLAAGVVVRKILHQAANNGNSNTSYEVDYTFTTAGGRKIESKDTVDPDAWDQLKEGGPVQIEYAASNPRINQIGAGGNGLLVYIFVAVASILWILGATLAGKGLLRRLSPPPQAEAPAPQDDSIVKSGNVQVELPSFLKDRIGPWTAFGTILLLCGAIFLVVGVINLRQERAFRAQGQLATAIVLTKRSHEEYDHKSGTHQTHYDLGYRFVTAGGQSIRGSDEVDWRTWRSTHERDPIQIIYLPRRPSRNRLAADHPGFLLWLVTVLGGLLTGGGTILLGYGLWTGLVSSSRPRETRRRDLRIPSPRARNRA